ncbi:glycogen debranching enzyme isoform X1 [Hyalella azteca]|uniref:Glycogen debranching enzyme n=1 Tax=Hyalella azteca TaxID=294128 RepID=A0A8B7NG99_HYAAZ|nr:glycogen debranching enzyme isoform X1 [Hyalella azteca]
MGPSPAPVQVRVLTLEKNQNLESKLFRLQKGWVVQFRQGATLFGQSVSLFTNCPASAGESFVRSSYRPLQWCSDSGSSDDTALCCQLSLTTAGSFRYYFTLQGSSSENGGSGYLLVDPTLTVGPEKTPLPLDCVQCQTVLSKNLGPFNQWQDRLRVAKETGYNMIHFTPIQALGGSNSAYSLADQHAVNVTFHSNNRRCSLTDIESLIQEVNNKWGVLSLTDIVLNHTANESPWLSEHPDATYNVVNSPHLRPAYLVDRALYYCSCDIASGKLAQWNMPPNISTEEHVASLSDHIFNLVLLPLHLEEFFVLDVEATVSHFKQLATRETPVQVAGKGKLEIVQDPQYRRKKNSVDFALALSIFNVVHEDCSEEDRMERCCSALRAALEELNSLATAEVTRHLHAAVSGTIGTVRYERLQSDGPKIPAVTAKHPLVPPYFTHSGPDADIAADELLMDSPKGNFLMAHNGWVMNHNPLKNFADPGSLVYLRRELVAWGDSVKLRYGSQPSDSPFLWDHMRRYCEYTARIFAGIRLDNCHSTPIHVAEYLLDAARAVRPELYVIAELFTNSDDTDNIFVNRLGINSLIREAMSAPNSHEEGRLVYRYGGEPVGAFLLPSVRPLVPSIAHAIFLDLTHDNKSPVEVRTAFDMLPSSALVSMACCASGSNRGYDELVPHHIHVVNERRLYYSWSNSVQPSAGTVNAGTGIIAAKRVLNDLHLSLGRDGFSQVFVDQVTSDVVTVTRHNPVTHESVVLVAYTSFAPPAVIGSPYVRSLKVQGALKEIIFEMEQRALNEGDDQKACPGSFSKDPTFINGLKGIVVSVREKPSLSKARLVRQASQNDPDTLEFQYTEHFKPGCVVAFRFSLLPKAQAAITSVRSTLAKFVHLPRQLTVTVEDPVLCAALASLDLVALNHCLYRCQQEEESLGAGDGVYDVPGWRAMVYAGLQGLESVLLDIRVKNDLGHPLCGNLRSGDWLMDYTVRRLQQQPDTQLLAAWLREVFAEVRHVPRYLVPAYFDAVINKLYLALINRAWQLMSPFVSGGSVFARLLGLCSVQFCSVIQSAQLPPLSPALAPPQPAILPWGGQRASSIAAGLPHFCVGYMRNWGRDTFIALPGNLLITGRFDEARWVILAFAGTLRHGLIPNLLDGGPKARYNCRDAAWFWLMAIQRYVEMVPEGHRILQDKVSRIFPRDDSDAHSPGRVDQTLEFVIQECMTRHFQGVQFRERNAGRSIDEQMTDQGFNNSVGVDLETGFPFGGNRHNCGTWMDKMGSSEKAGNKGRPATPRDGSAVEIVGLCKAAVSFLAALYRAKHFAYQGVTRIDDKGNEINWTYSFWAQQLSANFTRHFHVPKSPTSVDKRPDLINRRGIYKDSVGATDSWPDYQLRCNFPIALAVAPELVDPKEGLEALALAEELLLGPLGIKTLDPSDWAYRANYDNGNDSNDASVARGFNYHQGPEWLWPVGFLLRAQLALSQRLGDPEHLCQTVSRIKSSLSQHFTHLVTNEWRSLPELTNAAGALCPDSNPAQSWSTGCVLEVLWELERLQC